MADDLLRKAQPKTIKELKEAELLGKSSIKSVAELRKAIDSWANSWDKSISIAQVFELRAMFDSFEAGVRERIDKDVITAIDGAIGEWFDSVHDRSEWVNVKHALDGKLYVEWDWIVNSFRIVVGAKLREELRRVLGDDKSG